MKTGKEILLLSLIMVSLSVLVGCGKKVDEEETTEELIIEPLVGFESVQFGMSKDEIIEHFGQPDKLTTRTEGTKLNYVASKGLGFEVDSELGLAKIQCWSKSWPEKLPFRVANFIGKTKEGIGIGSTREQIISAYGQPDRTGTDDNKGIIETLFYDELRIRFPIWQGKVISMTLEAPK
jgi:hypothetical protein